jgi:hypothetical protein
VRLLIAGLPSTPVDELEWLIHCGFLGVDDWAELDPGQPPRVSAADPDVADPCADLNVVAVGGGSVALHGSDDGSVGEEPNVDLADIQLVVGEEVVPVDPLLLSSRKPFGPMDRNSWSMSSPRVSRSSWSSARSNRSWISRMVVSVDVICSSVVRGGKVSQRSGDGS